MKIEKHYLSLAGEYRVCAELLKRGVSATVTYGNMKAVDIFGHRTKPEKLPWLRSKHRTPRNFVTNFLSEVQVAG